jgi:hypothetical protein
MATPTARVGTTITEHAEEDGEPPPADAARPVPGPQR